MITSFGNDETELIFNGNVSKKLPNDIQRGALRKLLIIDAARSFKDLNNPPGNRHEHLRGDLAGYHSIRINDQWRIIFLWDEDTKNTSKVEVLDYH